MKPNRHLAKLLIPDLEQFSGMSFAYENGLTRAEAKQLEQWARAQPQVVAAYTNKAHPQHAAVKLFAETVRYFEHDHPQGANGEPAAWPAPSPEEARAVAENPFGVKTVQEAQARLAWAQTRHEYHDAYWTKEHPQHGDYVSQTQALMELVADAPGQPTDPASAGAKPPASMTTEAARAAARASISELQRNPAYLDKRDPGHAAAVAAVSAAYEVAYPSVDAPPASAAASPAASRAAAKAAPAPVASGGGNNAAQLARVRQLQAHPAYLDRNHPEHASTKAAMTAAYASAYPESAPGGGATVAPPA